MKTSKQLSFRKLMTTVIFSVFVAAFAFSVSPVSAQAATKKVSATTNYKKAPKLKVGTNKVTAKKNNSYVKFTAPKTGTYTFTISNIATIKGRNPDTNLGNLYIEKMSGSYLSTQRVSTNGGKNTVLWTATKDSYNRYYKGKKVTKDTYLATRYGKLKLKKGETVWLEYYYTGTRCTYTLKVKKS